MGKDDMKNWLTDMDDILNCKYFIKDPCPINATKDHTIIKKLYKKFPYLKENIWICPHPNAYNKLGYYLIWLPDGEVEEVFGENKVRELLFI